MGVKERHELYRDMLEIIENHMAYFSWYSEGFCRLTEACGYDSTIMYDLSELVKHKPKRKTHGVGYWWKPSLSSTKKRIKILKQAIDETKETKEAAAAD